MKTILDNNLNGENPIMVFPEEWVKRQNGNKEEALLFDPYCQGAIFLNPYANAKPVKVIALKDSSSDSDGVPSGIKKPYAG